jgi:hypothetical protein
MPRLRSDRMTSMVIPKSAVGIAYFEWFGMSFIWILPASLAAGAVAGIAVSLADKLIAQRLSASQLARR